jgi:hypothetical protein
MLEYLGDLLLLLDFDPDSLSIEDDQGKTLLQYLSADAFVRLENDYFPYTSFSIHSLILSGGEKIRVLFHHFPKKHLGTFHHAALNLSSSVEVLMFFLSESPVLIGPNPP